MTTNAERARELLDTLDKLSRATPGAWRWSENGNIVPAEYVQDCEIASVYTEREDDGPPANAEAIIAAVNFLREHGRAIESALSQAQQGEALPWGYYTLRDGKEEWHNERNSTYFQWLLGRFRAGKEALATAFPDDAVLLYTAPPAPVAAEGKLPGYVQTALAACEPHHADTLRDYIAMLSAPVADAVRGAADYVPGRLDLEAPPRIWLQIDTAGDNDDRDDHWPGSENVTWQDESIGGLEIEYVRADLATQNPVGDAVRGLVTKWRRIGTEDAKCCADELEATLAAQPGAGDGWMPIETAPADEDVLICNDKSPLALLAYRHGDAWYPAQEGIELEFVPTYWMRVPLTVYQQRMLTAAQAQGGGS